MDNQQAQNALPRIRRKIKKYAYWRRRLCRDYKLTPISIVGFLLRLLQKQEGTASKNLSRLHRYYAHPTIIQSFVVFIDRRLLH